MKVVGLITEYNPFHNGHLYHIKKSKEITSADYVVVVMSGNFLQRGTPAIISKETRTKMALLNGADLVLELPVCYSTGSAEYFASGAVALLDKLGIINSICFGSECGNIDVLTSIAKVLADEPADYKILLRNYLRGGVSYPLARSNALLDYMYSDKYYKKETSLYETDHLKEIIQNPNNILGIEYIKALLKRKSKITPYTLSRISNHYHDLALSDSISSATALRSSIEKNGSLEGLESHMPETVYELLKEQFLKQFPIYERDFSSILKYKLLSQSVESLSEYVDVSNDLSLRIKNNLDQFKDFGQFASIIKTKEMTHSRITRSLIHILLDLKTRDLEQYVKNDYISYIRVLGFRKSSSLLFHDIKKTSSIPLITKLAHSKNTLSGESLEMLFHDIFAADIYHTVVTDKFGSPFSNEYTKGLVIIDS